MPSLLWIGLPIHQVIGSVKFSNMFSSFSSFYILLKKKQLKLKDSLQLIPFALFGGLCGGLLANSFSEKAMNLLAICLLTVALMNFIKKTLPSDESDWHLHKKVYPSLFGISVYDGMFGPGQATMLMYTFLRNGATYLQSLAFTRFQTFISCTAAFITYFMAGNIAWGIAIYYTIGSLIGSQLYLACGSKNLHWTVEIHFTFGHDRIIDSNGDQSCISLKQRQTPFNESAFFLCLLILPYSFLVSLETGS